MINDRDTTTHLMDWRDFVSKEKIFYSVISIIDETPRRYSLLTYCIMHIL